MATIPDSARSVLESNRLAHMVTLNPDGSPQVSCPGVKFPPMPNPPPGHVIRIEPRRFGGNGPWTA